jgi:hypothetical protein
MTREQGRRLAGAAKSLELGSSWAVPLTRRQVRGGNKAASTTDIPFVDSIPEVVGKHVETTTRGKEH